MSVLIKGMKMPKNCGECKFCRMTYTQYGEIFSADCTIKDFPIKWSELDLRDGLCPLVEIPSHGRLIDADALEQEAQKRLLICNKYDDHFQKPYEVMRAIALAPIIIPAEEGE